MHISKSGLVATSTIHEFKLYQCPSILAFIYFLLSKCSRIWLSLFELQLQHFSLKSLDQAFQIDMISSLSLSFDMQMSLASHQFMGIYLDVQTF